eukprot:7376161-Prymnesium_polylepis.1
MPRERRLRAPHKQCTAGRRSARHHRNDGRDRQRHRDRPSRWRRAIREPWLAEERVERCLCRRLVLQDDVALVGAPPRHPVVVAVRRVDVVDAVAVHALAEADALPAHAAHGQERGPSTPGQPAGTRSKGRQDRGSNPGGDTAAAATGPPAPARSVAEVHEGVAARVVGLRARVHDGARADDVAVLEAQVDDSDRGRRVRRDVRRRRRRGRARVGIGAIEAPARVALGPVAPRVVAGHRRQQRDLLRDQLVARERRVPVGARAQQELEVGLQADGGDGDAPRRRGREHSAVDVEGVRHLRAVADGRREVVDDAVDVRQRRRAREGQPGALVGADGDVVAAIPVIDGRDDARAGGRRGVLHHREQVDLAVVHQRVQRAQGDDVVDVAAGAAAHVGVED